MIDENDDIVSNSTAGTFKPTISKWGRCECSCADRCPLGRMGMTFRCTADELDAAGITYQLPTPILGTAITDSVPVGDGTHLVQAILEGNSQASFVEVVRKDDLAELRLKAKRYDALIEEIMAIADAECNYIGCTTLAQIQEELLNACAQKDTPPQSDGPSGESHP